MIYQGNIGEKEKPTQNDKCHYVLRVTKQQNYGI